MPGRYKLVELSQHGGIVIPGLTVDGEHSGGFANTQGVHAGEHIVDVARQGGHMGDLRHMGFPVQHRLIQMGDGPALGDIEVKDLRQLPGGLGGDGILPGPEGHQQIPVLVKGQVAVHHGGDTHGGNPLPVGDPGNGSLQPGPDIV